jgi:hypothetical protein
MIPAQDDVSVDVSVQSITPLDKVELVLNGRVVEQVSIGPDRKHAALKKPVHVARSGWLHVRAEGRPAERFPLDADYAQAFTNPIWIVVGKRPIRDAAAAEYGLRWVDKLQQMAMTLGLWRSQEERDHVFAVFDEARQAYARLKAEAAGPVTNQR